MAKNTGGGHRIGRASRAVSTKRQEQGRAAAAATPRDPATHRFLPRAPVVDPAIFPPAAAMPAPKAAAKPAAKPAAKLAAKKKEEPKVLPKVETAPAAAPFRGRVSSRHPRSSAWRRTSSPPANPPKA